MKRLFGKIKDFFKGAGSFTLPSAVGIAGLLLSAIFGPHFSLTLFVLLFSWLGLKGVQWWGPEPAEIRAGGGRRLGPRAMVWAGMILVGLLAAGILYGTWFRAPWLPWVKFLQTIYVAAMAAGSIFFARRVLAGKRKDPSEMEEVLEMVAPVAEAAIKAKLKSHRRERETDSETRPLSEETALRVLRAAQRLHGVFTPADVAQQSRLSAEEAERVLDELYVQGKVNLEIDDRGELTYSLPGVVPRMSGEEAVTQEEKVDLRRDA